jgi:hypothetical protein
MHTDLDGTVCVKEWKLVESHLEGGWNVLVHGHDGVGGEPWFATTAPVESQDPEAVLILLLQVLTAAPTHAHFGVTRLKV